MPYLGNIPAEAFSSFDKQTITGDGGASYTLTHPVGSAQEVAIFVNNVRQEPGVAYTVTGTALTMTGNVASTDDFYAIFIGKARLTANPADNTVTAAMLQSDSVTTAKILDANVTTAKILDANVTNAKIDTMAASKLTGALPAIDGSALTNLDLPTDDHVRVTFSGPNISHNTITFLTPTLQAETGGGFSIQNTNEVLPSVSGHYAIVFVSACSITTAGGYTPISYVYKNTSNWNAMTGIRNYSGGSNLDFPTNATIVTMNGSTDFFKFALYQNAGVTGTSSFGTAVIFRLGD